MRHQQQRAPRAFAGIIPQFFRQKQAQTDAKRDPCAGDHSNLR